MNKAQYKCYAIDIRDVNKFRSLMTQFGFVRGIHFEKEDQIYHKN